MINIRQGVFETNSSSTHSITMCTKADFDAWKAGTVFMNVDCWWSLSANKGKTFVTRDEAIEILTNHRSPPDTDLAALDDDDFVEFLRDQNMYTYAAYFDGRLEEFNDTFVTPGGETVVAFGKYGEEW